MKESRGQNYVGDATFYTEWRGGYGSCGLDRALYDPFYVCALSRHFMALPPGMTNPNNHPKCDPQWCVEVKGIRGTIVVKVSDTCWGCQAYDVDVADAVYHYLDDPNKGRVRMNWRFVDCRTNPPGVK
ncbi:CLUMA_CG004180, isoform A [Clunio marinus]|uniref:CLUMA_CG004180, isoform A n=1 Tax=Clunio marinus TaxID=568069 RepID=A0A1J1HW98_9DIPT|nr:CLUMA_CG004180, isoform A [Clunio marinus]